MKKILLLLAVLFIALLSSAQSRSDTLKYRYVNQSLYRFGAFFIKGSERLTFGQLAHEFDDSPLGKVSYLKAKRTRTVSAVFRYGSLLTSVVTLTLLGRHSNDKNLYYGLLGGQIALGFASGWYGNESAKYLDEAIWLRNKDLLFPGR